jgi:hypothetical protein
MDAQPLLVVDCGHFVTRDGNIICFGQCFLDLIRDHVGYGMSDLPARWLRPSLPGRCGTFNALNRSMLAVESAIGHP